MTFRVYPDPPERPLSVASGTTSDPVAIEELLGLPNVIGLRPMFIRFAVMDRACNPPAGPAPTVLLISDGNQFEVTVNEVDPTPTPVAVGGAAFATIIPPDAAGRGVYLLRVSKKQTAAAIAWRLRFRNNHSDTQQYTWVVADTDAETRRPWIDLPTTATFEAYIDQTVTEPIPVANRGTGPLTIRDRAGFVLGEFPEVLEEFVLVRVPARVNPNACADLKISFTAGLAFPSPMTSSAVYDASSDDTTAQAQEMRGHNRRVTLKGRTKGFPPGTILVLEPDVGDSVALRAVNPITGAPLMVLGPLFVRASALAVEADGRILVAGSPSSLFPRIGEPLDEGVVVRVEPTGLVSDEFSGQLLATPSGVAVEDGGTIVVSDERAFGDKGGVIRIDPATGAQTPLARGGEMFVSPLAVAVGKDGTVLVLARTPDSSQGIFRIHPQTGVQSLLTRIAFSHNMAEMAVEANGKILIASLLETVGGSVTNSVGSLRRVNPAPLQESTLISVSDQSLRPVGMAVEPDGRILIANSGTPGLTRVNQFSGQRTSIFADLIRDHPLAIAVVPAASD
jgi:hypothetical protein